jgi:hypothetical protein
MSNPKGKQRLIKGQVMTVQLHKRTCGKATCQCRLNPDKRHGPYWTGYYYDNGKLKSFYIGKSLPEGVEA